MGNSVQAGPVIRFQDFQLNLDTGELWKAGIRLKLQDQPFKVLATLVQRPGQVITREELRQLIWPQESFGDFDHVLNLAVNKLRSALGDSAEVPHLIETLPRRGYRFITPVDSGTVAKSDSPPPVQRHLILLQAPLVYLLGIPLLLAVVAALILVFNVGGVGLRLWNKPTVPSLKSIAVLPLENLSRDPEQEYFADGMTEEIITKISRIPSLAVASRTSVARYKKTQKDVREVGRELGVRYVLEGSVRKVDNRVRITAQLIDSTTGFHLWAEDFDRSINDVFAVQDETALKIAGVLNLQLTPQVQEAVRLHYTNNPEAYDAYLRGEALSQYAMDLEKLQAAHRHFQQALQLDTNYAPALAGLAKIEAHIYRNHEPTQAHLRLAEQLAQQALALDHELPSAHVAMGFVYGIRYDYVHAAQEIREGIRLKSDDPWFWDQLSWTLAYLQPPDNAGAEQAAREAIRLLPNFPVAYFHLGRALLQQERYQEAVTALNRSLELDPASAAPHVGLSQVYLAQGNTDLALAEMDKMSFNAFPVALIQTSSIYAVRGEKERALVEMEKALRLGYRDFAALDSSPYLASLRADPRYQQLLGRYRK